MGGEIKKWPRFTGQNAEVLKRLFLAGESMNLDSFVTHFTDDALYMFGNSPAVYGPEGIRGPSLDFLKKVEGIHHHITNIWETADQAIFVEMEVTYVRHDGKVFTLPSCDIIRLKGDKVQEMRIFMDISPVYTTPDSRRVESEAAAGKSGD